MILGSDIVTDEGELNRFVLYVILVMLGIKKGEVNESELVLDNSTIRFSDYSRKLNHDKIIKIKRMAEKKLVAFELISKNCELNEKIKNPILKLEYSYKELDFSFKPEQKHIRDITEKLLEKFPFLSTEETFNCLQKNKIEIHDREKVNQIFSNLKKWGTLQSFSLPRPFSSTSLYYTVKNK